MADTAADRGSTAQAPTQAELSQIYKKTLRRQTWNRAIRLRSFYGLTLSALVLLIIFKYLPMWGVSISFVDYSYFKGLFGSPWNDFEHFRRLFNDVFFLRIFRNTVVFALLRMAIAFPAPIILALLLNELRATGYKRVVQSISYLPHFMSWVVLSGIIREVISPTRGAVGYIFTLLGWEPINWLTFTPTFRYFIVGVDIWQSVGWGTIIYLAALSSIDPGLYESAAIDGANRWKQAIHITLPGLVPVITVLFLLRVGNLIESGFEQIWVFYSPVVYEVADVFETYMLREGIIGGRYDYTTAIGLFQNVVGIVLLVIGNQIIRRYNEYGVW